MYEHKREPTKELIFGDNLKVRRARNCSNVPEDVPGKNERPGRTRRPMEESYGVKIPFTVTQAYHLDKLN